MFAVWQRILPTDRVGPRRWALSALADRRVRQYWDPDNLIASRMAADARPPQPALECCTAGDTIWDMAAVYPPGPQWTDRMPVAVVFNGPVVDITSSIESALSTPPLIVGEYRPR